VPDSYEGALDRFSELVQAFRKATT
jgi:hypothetical protein